MSLFGPEGLIALAGLAIAIALVLIHHLGERREYRFWRRVALLPGLINQAYLAGDCRETKAINQQVMIALIPEPVVVSHLEKLVAEQRVAAVYAAVLCEIGLHFRERRLLRVSLMA